jgi:hypothetical protein
LLLWMGAVGSARAHRYCWGIHPPRVAQAQFVPLIPLSLQAAQVANSLIITMGSAVLDAPLMDPLASCHAGELSPSCKGAPAGEAGMCPLLSPDDDLNRPNHNPVVGAPPPL